MNAIDTLGLIAAKARQDKKLKFTSLAHLINEESLAACYRELQRNKACGIDGVTVEGYGERLQENLRDLVSRMKSKRYRPQPVRRVHIPKPGKKGLRPLGIPSVEDKLVQLMVKKILEAIYEQDFLDCSSGFRPGRSCHTAIKQLNEVVMTRPINCIVEVDIAKFFDTVSHYWLLRCIEERVSDPNLLWLVRRFLKSGIVEDGKRHRSDVGTPQGGIVSPLLANIYLHYVLDLWFAKVFKPQAGGYVQLIRYCDDLVVACEEEEDGAFFLKGLEDRFTKFGLNLSAEKTKVVRFGRKVWERARAEGKKVMTFDFLGFTHYCKANRKGKFVIGHKTSKRNLASKLYEIKAWLKLIRNLFKLKDWWPYLKAKLRGHFSYFGISGNYRSIRQFFERVKGMVFKWINRRSQRKSMTWARYVQYLKWNPLPRPRIYTSIYPPSPIK